MAKLHKTLALVLSIPLSVVALGCDDEPDGDGESESHDTEGEHHDTEHESEEESDGHTHDNESEVITRVELTFTPDAGGSPVVAAFSDPDGDGGASGTIDPIALAADTTYTVGVTFANELEDPDEDITEEIREESEEHQIFFGGDAVGSLLTHAYADMESEYGDNAVGDDLPVGLVNTITTSAAGTGELDVQLQHLPEVNGEPVKVAGLADMFPSLPGEIDASVTFDVTVE